MVTEKEFIHIQMMIMAMSVLIIWGTWAVNKRINHIVDRTYLSLESVKGCGVEATKSDKLISRNPGKEAAFLTLNCPKGVLK
jgi:hypothetical protein